MLGNLTSQLEHSYSTDEGHNQCPGNGCEEETNAYRNGKFPYKHVESYFFLILQNKYKQKDQQ
ncbi:hypothetical protein CULCFH20161_15080 [Corynebacterium ulcerans]|nr:hypothetical protein CULC0211_15100 [Corynebacterium ulcerans]BBJ74681.1 hypothetical protein CULCFH20161_15080 [Corynebacterium ulcerans]